MTCSLLRPISRLLHSSDKRLGPTIRWVFFFAILCTQVQAQSPYLRTPIKDIPLTVGAVSFSLGGHLYQRGIDPLSTSELLALDPARVNSFDRVATRAWRPFASRLSDVGLISAALAPLGFLATAKPVRQDASTYLLLWWQALSITDGLTTWTKSFTLRPRPFTYYFAVNQPQVPAEVSSAVGEADARFAYFSGHTSLTSVSTFFLANTFSDYYPDSRAKPWIWVGAALLPAAVGFWRVRAGKHYPTDVITGYLVGAAVGTLIPAWHRQR